MNVAGAAAVAASDTGADGDGGRRGWGRCAVGAVAARVTLKGTRRPAKD